VRTSTGSHPYVRLDAHNLTWLVAGRCAVEFDSWSPTSDDPTRAAFGRLILAPRGTATDESIFTAAAVFRDALASEQLQAILVLDGFRGASLWIPFDDGPTYDRLGAWLHHFATKLAAEYADTLTTAPLIKDRGDRVYIGTKSNHPGMGSLLPYALRGTPSLEMALPLAWHDLGKIVNGSVTAATFPNINDCSVTCSYASGNASAANRSKSAERRVLPMRRSSRSRRPSRRLADTSSQPPWPSSPTANRTTRTTSSYRR